MMLEKRKHIEQRLKEKDQLREIKKVEFKTIQSRSRSVMSKEPVDLSYILLRLFQNDCTLFNLLILVI